MPEQENDKPLNDVVIVLSGTELNDEGNPYPTTQVFRFDFLGTAEDLKRVFRVHDDLFIEGGMMQNVVGG